VPYLEAREAVELEQKEVKAAREQLGREIREACRPEIDESFFVASSSERTKLRVEKRSGAHKITKAV
jgi:hypothetical protein